MLVFILTCAYETLFLTSYILKSPRTQHPKNHIETTAAFFTLLSQLKMYGKCTENAQKSMKKSKKKVK